MSVFENFKVKQKKVFIFFRQSFYKTAIFRGNIYKTTLFEKNVTASASCSSKKNVIVFFQAYRKLSLLRISQHAYNFEPLSNHNTRLSTFLLFNFSLGLFKWVIKFFETAERMSDSSNSSNKFEDKIMYYFIFK